MTRKHKKKTIPLYLQIILGMILGLLWGLTSPRIPGGSDFTLDYIQPFGVIFIRLLQMIAIPLVFASLLTGVARLRDLGKLRRIGSRTLALFIFTALIATTIGITLSTLIRPGKVLPESTREELLRTYGETAGKTVDKVKEIRESPLKPLVNMVPDNVFSAAGDNTRLLQVVFFALLFGIALTRVSAEKGLYVLKFFEGVNDILIRLVGIIMHFAPFGVFALMASVIVEIAGDDPSGALQLLYSLFWYGLTVILGLLCMLLIIYPTLFRLLGGISYGNFFRGMRPAFLLAFSTSSSSATLPVTMERVEKHLGVSEEVAGFVLPFGTTINMDGTALYQCIAAVFIAQAFGMDLSITQQLIIVFTATLAAVGAAGVPGAGMITLVMVLEGIGVPVAGIALIMAPDRILDMCRTVINVAGDATAALVINNSEKRFYP